MAKSIWKDTQIPESLLKSSHGEKKLKLQEWWVSGWIDDDGGGSDGSGGGDDDDDDSNNNNDNNNIVFRVLFRSVHHWDL